MGSVHGVDGGLQVVQDDKSVVNFKFAPSETYSLLPATTIFRFVFADSRMRDVAFSRLIWPFVQGSIPFDL